MMDFNPYTFRHSESLQSWPPNTTAESEMSPSNDRPQSENSSITLPLTSPSRSFHRGCISRAPAYAAKTHLFSECDDWTKVPSLPFTLTTVACSPTRNFDTTTIVLDPERIVLQASPLPIHDGPKISLRP
ncbi:hypothetical protein DL93DRAFT_413146 [Clavulina sp. PMI_390]|nr:hypothetical protein DL93DRAFT_413146 [Clavulina sp. PMI_390]